MSMIERIATGRDFDRINDMSAISRLRDLVELASGAWSHDSTGAPIPNAAIRRGIESRSHFVMEVW